MNKMNLRDEIRSNKKLIGLMCEFNYNLACYTHKSWIEDIMPYEIFKSLKMSEKGKKKLSKSILKHNKLNKEFINNTIDRRYRLALLPYNILKKLTFYGGIAINYREIKKIIEKKKKESIVKNLGEHGYRFAVESSPLLLGKLDLKINTHLNWERLSCDIQECGNIFFLKSYEESSVQLYKRLILKFPKNIGHNKITFKDKIHADSILSFYLRIFRQIGDEQWQRFVL
jgi:hypothetical protein